MRKPLRLGLAAAMLAFGVAAAPAAAQAPYPYKQAWDPARVRPCDRACLVGIMDGYLRALETKDRSQLAFGEDTPFTENTGKMDIGEGVLWRAKLEPTRFRITVADPVTGQVAVQMVYRIEGKPALVAIRLKVERRLITEVEQLYDRNVAPQAMELLQTPRPTLVNDLPASERASREYMIYAASAYFDALTGESGAIAPFAHECVRHEQGYQTVFNAKPGRAAPSPALPDLSTPQGRQFSRLSTMTCAEQIDTKIFAGIKRIWPRRVLIVDEQKGLVGTFPFFVHDGTRRHAPDDPPDTGALGMVTNLTTMETFGIRNGKIYDVEAFPFVTTPYGTGNGWSNATAH